jgi:hypothetical protein
MQLPTAFNEGTAGSGFSATLGHTSVARSNVRKPMAPIWRLPCVKLLSSLRMISWAPRSDYRVGGYHLSDKLCAKKDVPAAISLNFGMENSEQQLVHPMAMPRSGEMCSGLLARKLWNRTRRWVPSIIVAVYFGELLFTLALAIVLLAASTSSSSIAVLLFCCGLVAWTLAEYITHRFVLHAIAPVEHGMHHARPRDTAEKVFWQIWLAFGIVYLTAGGILLAGALVAYAWYLSVHYCAHHNPAILPASMLKHHRDHHRVARLNYGVTTKFWDRAFGTMLRCS